MSIITRTDVTAVKLYKNYILAGIGSFINVFEKESAKLLQRFQGLNGQKIYGFVSSKCARKILVFGGKQFTVVSEESAEPDNVLTRLFEPVLSDDWLHSGVWTGDGAVALLTAHNVVQKWDTINQTLLSQHVSRDNSILYSGLLVSLHDDVLVLAGTVFSEVIIHLFQDVKPLHHLKGHRGVIFSISCHLEREIIVTTSDDRSLRIWNVKNMDNHTHNTKEYWQHANIICKHEVYGHTARVMRSCILEKFIISVGEDSAICFWDDQGNLARKIMTHQNGCIWSVDNDEELLVTGGGDCSVILHPLTVASDYGQNEVLDIKETPKKILFTARRNLVILSDKDNLIYYDTVSKCKMLHKLKLESTFRFLSLSSCKQIIAVADMCGQLDVYVENCKDTAYILNVISTKLQIGDILSMQWAGNRHLVFCSVNGAITVLASYKNKTEVYANFKLPFLKERWLTSSAVDSTNTVFILGDRCGNIHVYAKDNKDPIRTFKCVHGRYGPTSITVRNNEIMTTGRNGTIKYFRIKNNTDVEYLSCKELEFQWVEKCLDKHENLVCGFQERVFVVYNLKTNSKLLEVSCGGGHRCWDAIRYFAKEKIDHEEFIKLLYLKNSDIHIVSFQLSNVVSRNVVNGSHCKEINTLISYTTELDDSTTFCISGGEDTTLRISSLNSELLFQDEVVFKQLSNIRALKLYSLERNKILLISAGGRAQICVKIITFMKLNDEIQISTQEIVNYLVKGTDKDRKRNQTWRNCSVDFDPETRIMDLDFIKASNNDFMLFTGCSDASLRVFKLTYGCKDSVVFKLLKEIKHHTTCILQTHCIKHVDKHFLITGSTKGEVTFWNVSNLDNMETFDVKPVFTTITNKSGINSFALRILSDTNILIATGGDDNTVHLIVVDIPDHNDLESMKVTYKWSRDRLHGSQITGLCLLDEILLSTSIDQRITMLKWKVDDNGIYCEFLSQTFSDIADIQGMNVLKQTREAVTICVYGKGIEVVTLARPR